MLKQGINFETMCPNYYSNLETQHQVYLDAWVKIECVIENHVCCIVSRCYYRFQALSRYTFLLQYLNRNLLVRSYDNLAYRIRVWNGSMLLGSFGCNIERRNYRNKNTENNTQKTMKALRPHCDNYLQFDIQLFHNNHRQISELLDANS